MVLNIAETPQFQDADKSPRVPKNLNAGPNGAVARNCNCNVAYKLTPKPSKKGKHVRKARLQVSGLRTAVHRDRGTRIFEIATFPKQMAAGYSSSLCVQEGMSAHQMHRMLGVTYKSAWFMAHRIAT